MFFKDFFLLGSLLCFSCDRVLFDRFVVQEISFIWLCSALLSRALGLVGWGGVLLCSDLFCINFGAVLF